MPMTSPDAGFVTTTKLRSPPHSTSRASSSELHADVLWSSTPISGLPRRELHADVLWSNERALLWSNGVSTLVSSSEDPGASSTVGPRCVMEAKRASPGEGPEVCYRIAGGLKGGAFFREKG